MEESPMSDDDILDLLDHKASLILYPDLAKSDNIDDYLQNNGACVILYETKKNFGHWCCIFKTINKNELEFFDPYGLPPDAELKYIDYNFRKSNNELRPHLTHLLLNSNYKVTYSNYRFQKMMDDINTCGDHVVCRLLFKFMPLKKYAKLLKKVSTCNADCIVAKFTESYKDLKNII